MVLGSRNVSDATSQLRSATRRAKSDVANKLVSMFLHELSRRICKEWSIRVESENYEKLVRNVFNNRCPYCSKELDEKSSVIEHLDGMNQFRIGLHIPGNVLVACRKCNNEKRRDDSRTRLTLAQTGWESFLSHDGTRCLQPCRSCQYWAVVWENGIERKSRMTENIERIRAFRRSFPQMAKILTPLAETLPSFVGKLYSDCQDFAEDEIRKLIERVDEVSKLHGTQGGPRLPTG